MPMFSTLNKLAQKWKLRITGSFLFGKMLFTYTERDIS